MRLLRGNTLLPRNVERHQWVSRYCRIKALLNVAGLIILSHAEPKLNGRGDFLMSKTLSTIVESFFNERKVTVMDSGPLPSRRKIMIRAVAVPAAVRLLNLGGLKNGKKINGDGESKQGL